MKKVFIFLIFLSFAFGADTNKLYKADINSKTAYEMQQKGYMIIDVRTIPEYKFSRVPNSKNIPIYHDRNGERVFNENFLEQIDYAVAGKTDTPLILICRTGSRTREAANLLAKNGYTNIYNVEKGFVTDWIKTPGLPVEK